MGQQVAPMMENGKMKLLDFEALSDKGIKFSDTHI
jgi:hypothetical protein